MRTQKKHGGVKAGKENTNRITKKIEHNAAMNTVAPSFGKVDAISDILRYKKIRKLI